MTTIPELRLIMADVFIELTRLDNEAMDLQAIMHRLEAEGITDATEHWRADRAGNRTILELIHPMGSDYEQKHGRRREYIGTDPDNIRAAQKRQENMSDWKRYGYMLNRATEKRETLTRMIRQLALVALGQQQSLWGQDNRGDIRSESDIVPSKNVSPQDMSCVILSKAKY